MRQHLHQAEVQKLLAADRRHRRASGPKRDEDEHSGGEDEKQTAHRRPVRARAVAVRQRARQSGHDDASQDGVQAEGDLPDEEDHGGKREQRNREGKRCTATRESRTAPRREWRTDDCEHAEDDEPPGDEEPLHHALLGWPRHRRFPSLLVATATLDVGETRQHPLVADLPVGVFGRRD